MGGHFDSKYFRRSLPFAPFHYECGIVAFRPQGRRCSQTVCLLCRRVQYAGSPTTGRLPTALVPPLIPHDTDAASLVHTPLKSKQEDQIIAYWRSYPSASNTEQNQAIIQFAWTNVSTTIIIFCFRSLLLLGFSLFLVACWHLRGFTRIAKPEVQRRWSRLSDPL